MAPLALVTLLLYSVLAQSSFVTASGSSSNTCVRRSVFVYTADSSTYVVTNLGSTTLAATPSMCPNASITVTSTPPASTVTVFQQQTASAAVANGGFENGNVDPFATSASGPGVTSQISTGQGSLQPHSGQNFLLISYTDSAPQRTKRQANTPLVYNVSQEFDAVGGATYTFTAFASEATVNGDTPACSSILCIAGSCSAPSALTGQYMQYAYQYTPASTDNDVTATISVQCLNSAYVALDDISLSANGTEAPSYSLITTTVLQYVTQTLTTTQTSDMDITISASNALGSTATEEVTISTTQYDSVTITQAFTTTSTFTSIDYLTTTLVQPSTVVLTETTYSTDVLTVTAPDSFIETDTETPPATTQVLTSVVYSTVTATSTVLATQSAATSLVPTTIYVTQTPQPGTTTDFETEVITRSVSVTLPDETSTRIDSQTTRVTTTQVTTATATQVTTVTATQTTSLTPSITCPATNCSLPTVFGLGAVSDGVVLGNVTYNSTSNRIYLSRSLSPPPSNFSILGTFLQDDYYYPPSYYYYSRYLNLQGASPWQIYDLGSVPSSAQYLDCSMNCDMSLCCINNHLPAQANTFARYCNGDDSGNLWLASPDQILSDSCQALTLYVTFVSNTISN